MKGEKELTPLNYIYFSLFFLATAALQVYHVVLIGASSPFIMELYISLAILESFIETVILSWVSIFLRKKRMKPLYWGFLCTLTIFFLLRLCDFAVVRLMDVSVWRWIELIAKETFASFIALLYATNVQMVIWIAALALVVALVVIGCLAFYFSHKVSSKKPLFFSTKQVLKVIAIATLAIGAVDLYLYATSNSDASFKYAKALPWKRTLLKGHIDVLTLQKNLKVPGNDLEQFDSSLVSLKRKPDVFLFVVESLREDFLTEMTAPNLAQFRDEESRFPNVYSIANGTVQSWFSLFYSVLPFHWMQYQPTRWEQGGIPLVLLKKMGYQINVYASSCLNYYSMGESIFGKNKSLADEIHEFRLDKTLTGSQSDAMAIEKLCQDIGEKEEMGGRLFIVFLDATHFHYSWPEEKPILFEPIDHKIDYLKVACQRKGLESVKNRYKNSIHYVDELFGSFQKTLKEKKMWDDSVVVFTADHGEEFDEHGCIFHASNLSSPQLRVPLYMKMGKTNSSFHLDTSKITSQIDIFPTLVHYLVGEDRLSSYFQGQSLFNEKTKDYAIGARCSFSAPPHEFYIQKDGYRLILEFCDRNDVFGSRFLKIKGILDEQDQRLPVSSTFIQSHFGEALDRLFSAP